jgi:hypothetical protein
MKKSEHYKAAIAALMAERDRIEAEIATARKELLAAVTEESPFKPGDKVRFRNWYGNEWKDGIFGRYETSMGNPRPTIFKIKKDGTASLLTHWVGSGPEILPAE